MMATLQEICLLITDGKHGDCQNEEASGFYFVSCKDVKDGWIDYSGARQITKKDYLDTHKRTQLEPKDILITNSGTIGRMALVTDMPETSRTTFQKSVAIIKPNPQRVFSKWLFYSLLANRETLISWAGGTAQKNLLLRDLRAFDIHIPPFPTQQKIAAILSAYDDLIENNTRRIKILEEMAQTIYREWFVNFRFPGHEKVKMVDSPLGRIPKGWEIRKLGDVATIAKGKKPSQVYEIFQKDLVAQLLIDVLRGQKPSYTTPKGMIEADEDDTLMVMDGSGSANVFIGFKGAVGSTLARIKTCDPKELPPYALFLFLLAHNEEIKSKNTGAAIPHANKDFINLMAIAIPSVKVNEEFHSCARNLYLMINILRQKNANLCQTRDLLLPKLISGELDVSELDIKVDEIGNG